MKKDERMSRRPTLTPKRLRGCGLASPRLASISGWLVMMPRIVSPTMWQHKTITTTTWTQLLITQGFAFVLRRARKTHTNWERYICICIAKEDMWHVGGVGVINESYLPRLFLGCHAPSPALACLRHAIPITRNLPVFPLFSCPSL